MPSAELFFLFVLIQKETKRSRQKEASARMVYPGRPFVFPTHGTLNQTLYFISFSVFQKRFLCLFNSSLCSSKFQFLQFSPLVQSPDQMLRTSN